MGGACLGVSWRESDGSSAHPFLVLTSTAISKGGDSMTQKKKDKPTKIEISYKTVRPKDNWKDRESGRVCATCLVFIPKISNSGEVKIGRCRACPPTMRGYPVVFPSDWCGAHKLDENKI